MCRDLHTEFSVISAGIFKGVLVWKNNTNLYKFHKQAVHDGVDILSLSVGPNSPPATTKTTYLNPFDATLLSAVKAGVFVAQAAGNGGPFPKTMVSYSPWITSVAAAIDDRRYKNHLILGNGKSLPGIGLSRKFHQTHFVSLRFTL